MEERDEYCELPVSDDPANPPQPPFEAYTGDEPYIFVSYSHRDAAIAYPEIERLNQLDYRIWYDEGIDPGNEWPEEVAHALEGCQLFLVLISPNAVISKNVRNEVHYALNHSKAFIAVHLQATELPRGLELRMGDIQAVMKYRMADDRYRRQMEKALPDELRRPRMNRPSQEPEPPEEATTKGTPPTPTDPDTIPSKPAEKPEPIVTPKIAAGLLPKSVVKITKPDATPKIVETLVPPLPKQQEREKTKVSARDEAAAQMRVKIGVAALIGASVCTILNVIAASSASADRFGVRSTGDFVVVVVLGLMCGSMIGLFAVLARGPRIGAIVGIVLSIAYFVLVHDPDPFVSTMCIPFVTTMAGMFFKSDQDEESGSKPPVVRGKK